MKQELTIKKNQLVDNNILIKKYIAGIEGGRTIVFPELKVSTSEDTEAKTTTKVTTGFEDAIMAGTVIIKLSNGDYSALPIKKTVVTPGEGSAVEASETSAYEALPEGASYAGILVGSIVKENNAGAIMTWGIVNSAALPCAVPADFKTALPHIDFKEDEEA